MSRFVCVKAWVINPFGAAALLPPQLQAQPTQAGHGYRWPSDAFATIYFPPKLLSFCLPLPDILLFWSTIVFFIHSLVDLPLFARQMMFLWSCIRNTRPPSTTHLPILFHTFTPSPSLPHFYPLPFSATLISLAIAHHTHTPNRCPTVKTYLKSHQPYSKLFSLPRVLYQTVEKLRDFFPNPLFPLRPEKNWKNCMLLLEIMFQSPHAR